MEAIERLLREAGQRVEYATVFRDGSRRRVRAEEAYSPDCGIGDDIRGLDVTAIAVECRPAVLYGSAVDGIDWSGVVYTIDHHNPGDFGYGIPARGYWPASSIGQIVTVLVRLGALPPDWIKDPPRDVLLVAAADHCLTAAYRGECPGVDPNALMEWRAESRAAFQKISKEEILERIKAAIEKLAAAPGITIGGVEIADMRFHEPPVPELPEAAARMGAAYISGPELIGPGDRKKFTVSGPASVVQAFLAGEGPAGELADRYGDPARGFAGGYV